MITPLPILQRKRWQSVLWPDEGDPVEKGGRRWAQASQRQEQKWEEVQVCHPLNRNTKDTIFFEICFAETPRLTILLRLMLQCKVKDELHTTKKGLWKEKTLFETHSFDLLQIIHRSCNYYSVVVKWRYCKQWRTRDSDIDWWLVLKTRKKFGYKWNWFIRFRTHYVDRE